MTTKPLIIVFTRWPEPGKTKTRLIPGVGAEGAAQIQQQMTEHMADAARAASALNGAEVEVHYSGNDVAGMRDWLGADIVYREQADGDLGAKIRAAFHEGFERGYGPILLTGTDCPELNGKRLREVFERLRTHDVVVGPAEDGGYYLVGMRRENRRIFEDVDWGTDSVLATTLQRADTAGLSWHLVEKLRDVDRPEDVAHWESIRDATQRSRPTISIVMPVLNEAQMIGQTLAALPDTEGIEIIVTDGGSSDETVAIARRFNARVLCSPKGRARQMNTGARLARGDILLFLHGDTALPDGFAGMIKDALTDASVTGGAFRFGLDDHSPGLWLVDKLTNFRSSVFLSPYGDQCLFIRRDIFRRIGGYQDVPILEDVKLVESIKREGRIVILDKAAICSARRWKRLGVIRTTLLHRLMMLAHGLGTSPQNIAKWLKRMKY